MRACSVDSTQTGNRAKCHSECRNREGASPFSFQHPLPIKVLSLKVPGEGLEMWACGTAEAAWFWNKLVLAREEGFGVLHGISLAGTEQQYENQAHLSYVICRTNTGHRFESQLGVEVKSGRL